MGSINRQKVIVGGLVAGVVLAVLDTLVSMYVVGPWMSGMPGALAAPLAGMAASKRMMIGFPLSDVLFGITVVWLYAAIRPRYGAGAKTAMCAAFAVWFVAAITWGSYYLFRLMSLEAFCIAAVASLIEMYIAAWVGCRMYSEEGAG